MPSAQGLSGENKVMEVEQVKNHSEPFPIPCERTERCPTKEIIFCLFIALGIKTEPMFTDCLRSAVASFIIIIIFFFLPVRIIQSLYNIWMSKN